MVIITVILLIAVFLSVTGLFFSGGTRRADAEVASHLDKFTNPFGCSACHAGHGKRGTPMLRKHIPELCFDCHSPMAVVSTSASAEVYAAFKTQYAHPVEETAQFHRAGETMPEEDAAAPRHVSCLDCHNHHISEKTNPVRGVRGLSVAQIRKRSAEKVSEVCYKCHAESLNRPPSSRNVREEFDPVNRSYHPVERPARGQSPSIEPRLRGEKIECTDCHDPHGSNNEAMLKANYSRSGGPESPYAYELCYACHRRDSILADQGFSSHRAHVVYQSVPCSACHAPHGSRMNERMIEFDASVARPNSAGMVMYVKAGRASSCLLNCHGVEHDSRGVVRAPREGKRK